MDSYTGEERRAEDYKGSTKFSELGRDNGRDSQGVDMEGPVILQ